MMRDGGVGVSGRIGCAGGVGLTDGELGELAVIVHELGAAHAAVAAAEAARVRALSRAHALAGRVASGQPVAVVARDMVLRGIAAEVAGILRVSDRWAQRQIVDAADLVGSYPGLVDAWEAGAVTRSHVSVITELGSPLPVEARAVFSDTAVAVCGTEVPGRARARLAMVAERLHPRSFAERHERARESRCVKVTDIGEGMAELMATLPSVLAHAVYDRLTAQGRAVDDARIGARKAQHAALRASTRSGVPTPGAPGLSTGPAGATEASGVPGAAGAGGVSPEAVFGRVIPSDVVESDRRSMDQIRADILTDMLLTGDPCADPTRDGDRPGVLGTIRARVQVTVPALTLLGADEGPAALAGHAPIDPATARRLLGTSIHPWERLLTHPVTGSVVEVDTYQRPASLERFLRARDQHCRFPGCRLAAIRCDIDHTTDWAHGGATRRTNLAHLCRRHHSMKHATPWRVTQHHDGVLHWTSPLGHTYTDVPEPPVAFTPDHEPGEPQHREHDPGGGRPPGNARGPGSRPASEGGHPSGSAPDPGEHPFGHVPLGHVDALWAMRYADAPF